MKTSKEQIIQAATRLFIRKGYHGVNLIDLEASVGIMRGGLFYHIEGKEHLYKESLKRYFELVEAVESHFKVLLSSSFIGFIEQYLISMEKTIVYLTEYLDSDAYFGYLSFFLLAANEDPTLIEKFDQINAAQIEVWKKALQQAIRKGEVRANIDVASVATLFRNAGVATFYDNSLNGKGLQLHQLRKMMRSLYEMIKV